MKTRLILFGGLLAACAVPSRLPAQAAAPAPNSADPLLAEEQLIADAHQAAVAGDDAQVDADLASASGLYGNAAPTVALARRAAAVCGWLENDNRYGLAMKLARRVTAELAAAAEPSPTDREERLYWEGWLEGEVLDDKADAVKLLQAAEQLSPKDERVIDLELPLASALKAFGH